MIHITIPGKAIPMKRPRVIPYIAWTNGYPHARSRTHNPAKMSAYERYARIEGMSQYKGKPLESVPLFIKCIVFVQMPRSWSKRKKRHMENRFCIKRPDLDNYGKDIVDAFNKLIYKDDNLVAEENLAKMYSKNPRVEFYVKPIKETPIN